MVSFDIFWFHLALFMKIIKFGELHLRMYCIKYRVVLTQCLKMYTVLFRTFPEFEIFLAHHICENPCPAQSEA